MPESDDLDRSETHQDTGTDEPRSTPYQLLVRIIEYGVVRALFYVGFAAFALTFLLSGLGIAELSIPRPVHIAGLTMVFLILPARYAGDRIISWLWDPDYVWIIDLDAREKDGGIYRWPTQRFREVDIVDGDLDWLHPSLAVGKNVDLDDNTIEGTWRGTVSDRVLLRKMSAIEDCRTRLEEGSKRGFAIETQASSIIRASVRWNTRRIVSFFEEQTLPDEGDSLDEEIDRALDSFGLERWEGDDNSPTADLPGEGPLDESVVDLDGDQEPDAAVQNGDLV